MAYVTSGTFDDAVASFRQWQDAPWGRLRYTLADANLRRHLDGQPMRVLDAAGGNGVEAVRLATDGHRVTLIDYSGQMLRGAHELAVKAGVADRITIIEADIATLGEHVDAGDFDLVLCHNLLPYVTDVAATLDTCLTALRPGGLLSIIAVNAHSDVLRIAVRDQDPAAALEAVLTGIRTTKTFGAKLTPRTAEEVTTHLRVLGATVLGDYGIRSVCDYMADDDRKYDASFYTELENLELALADRLPYKLTARLFHVVAIKPDL